MAVIYGNKSYANGSSNATVIPKPEGLVEGAIMIAHLSTIASGDSHYWNPPSGWVSLNSIQNTTLSHQTFWKVATAADVSATNFSFGLNSSTAPKQLGTIFYVVGAKQEAPTYQFGSQFYTAASTISGITPSANSLIAILASYGDNAAGSYSVSGYSIATSNPIWIEKQDIFSNQLNHSFAIATRPESTATGTVSVSGDSTPDAAQMMILSFAPDTSLDTVKLLAVGAGGGGGYMAPNNNFPGAGGAGEYFYNDNFPITSNSINVTIGQGVLASNGESTYFGFLKTIGGGAGGNGNDGRDGNSGASGGGGGSGYSRAGLGGISSTGYGYSGSNSSFNNCGGSGGGSSSNGSNPVYVGPYYVATGGSGTANSITGVSVTYAKGGSATGATAISPTPTPNTGDGANGDRVSNGTTGASGVVIISYPTSGNLIAIGGTKTTSGGNTIHTFTSNGTFTIVNPEVSTQAVSSIDRTKAIGNGTVISDGGYVITERGFCWDIVTNPTILDNTVVVSGTTGSFTGELSGLTGNTTYYVRAYAKNSQGISYGEEVSFTTLSIATNAIYKDISGVEGQTYAVRLYVGGTTGTLTVSLGSTGSSQVFNAGDGYVTLQGTYSGLTGLIFEASETFDGYIDDVSWVLVLGTSVIDWSLNTLTNVYPINSSVLFKRIEDKDFNMFRIYRILDIQFKDLDAYVTVELKKEANENLTTDSKQFLVSNASEDTLPFINKKLSMLTKNQAIRIGVSNNRLGETFTICQLVIKGYDQSSRLFDGGKIINIT